METHIVTTLIEFLEARLRDDLDDANDIHNRSEDAYLDGDCNCEYPARVLREVKAKRRVMERHCPDMQPYTLSPDEPPYAQYCRECENNLLDDCPELRDLAAVYSDHDGWREEWRP